jgi:hypothetical protein
MKLWKLYARTPHEQPFGWDTHQGFVIRAETEEQAREIAVANCSPHEGGSVWLDNDFTSCEEVLVDGEPGAILYDYNAG